MFFFFLTHIRYDSHKAFLSSNLLISYVIACKRANFQNSLVEIRLLKRKKVKKRNVKTYFSVLLVFKNEFSILENPLVA